MPSHIAIIPSSHLDLFWLGDYRSCLTRGDYVLRSYIDRCLAAPDETFLVDTVVFAEHFLRSHPDYRQAFDRLVSEGRLEIGAAYVDRWEGLVLAESHIRNIQIGRAWARERGIDAQTASHPDLPSLNAQTSQIYAQAGVRYYVTSRKIFQEGRVWRHRSPDGTALLFLTWPRHYVFVPLRVEDVPEHARPRHDDSILDVEDVAGRFPAGTVVICGSAGDLAAPEDFVHRYGQDLREYVGAYRRRHPETTFSYTIPSIVLAPYAADADLTVLEVAGTLPSVWGVAADEEARFFRRARTVEHLLLSAETAAVVALDAGRAALPPGASSWRGQYAEDAYFAPPDPPVEGRELELLWRMQVFTQDHNGGGQDGVQSSFEKRVRQDRLATYCDDVADHALALDETPGSRLIVLNPRLGERRAAVRLGGAERDRVEPHLSRAGLAFQRILNADGQSEVALRLAPFVGVGTTPLELAPASVRVVNVCDDDEHVVLRSPDLELRVNRQTGEVEVADLRRGHTWRGLAMGLRAVPELGNDVTLATDDDAAVSGEMLGVDVLEVDSSEPTHCRQVRLSHRLLDVEWTTMLTVWADSPRIDVDVAVQWPGIARQQIRYPIVQAPRADQVTYGTALHASRWDDVPDGMRTGAPDEIAPTDVARYREVQHWLHVSDGAAGLVVVTDQPAFHHDVEAGLEAVLLRTAPSCGDPRMIWENSGGHVWRFELHLADPDVAAAAPAEIADAAWRVPVVRPSSDPVGRTLLVNTGDPVHLSALLPGSRGRTLARLVNLSDRPARVALTGRSVAGTVQLLDLQDHVQREVDVEDGTARFELSPWRIQTIGFAPRP